MDGDSLVLSGNSGGTLWAADGCYSTSYTGCMDTSTINLYTNSSSTIFLKIAKELFQLMTHITVDMSILAGLGCERGAFG